MSTEIRELLAAAQSAEVQGDVPEAVRLLVQAATWYADRNLDPRARQMLRHARRLRGEDITGELATLSLSMDMGDEALLDDELDPGDSASDDSHQHPSRRTRDDDSRESLFDRGPARADPAIGAWCSFCCRPQTEVGLMVAGPAGAFICAGCLAAAGRLLDVDLPALPPPPPPASTPQRAELPAQLRARQRLESRRPRLALVLGPEGAGKSELLRSLGTPTDAPFDTVSGDHLLVDLSRQLTAHEEARVIAWLDGAPGRRAVLAARGTAPAPALVLAGEAGEEAVYDTAALVQAVGALVSQLVLARVDAVVSLEAPDRAALKALALQLLAARGAQLPDEAVEQVVGLAEAAGRGAHELAALISRVPAGSWKAR